MKALERVATRPALHVSRLFAVVVAIWTVDVMLRRCARRAGDPNRVSAGLRPLNWTVILLCTSHSVVCYGPVRYCSAIDTSVHPAVVALLIY
jgi:hypothetical protein